MAATFGFAAPNAGRTIDDLDSGTPIFLVRSDQDEVPGINGRIDRFVSSALEANRAISLVNLPDAPHSFDTLHDTGESREVIRRALALLLMHHQTALQAILLRVELALVEIRRRAFRYNL